MTVGLVGLLLSIACLGGAGDTSLPMTKRPFGDSIGLNVKFVQGQPLTDLASLTELRVRWVRENVWWPDIEPAPGKFVEFSPVLKRQLAFYRQHDIGFVALLGLGNDRAYPATAADPRRPYDSAAFARFAVAVARMLKAEGVRFVIELGNEPHTSGLVKAFGGAWNGKAPSPWVTHYVAMVGEAVRRVKAFDSSIKLLSDDDMWIVHYWFLEAGLPPALDGFALHPYAEVPEVTAVAHDTDWTRPFQVVDRDRSFTSAVRRLREAGQVKLGRVPEIWLTEWGWPVDSGPFKKWVTEDVLAAYVPRTFVLAAAAGVEVLCWFSAQDSVDGPMGLSDNALRRREPYRAFKTMGEQLGAYTWVRQVAGAKRPTAGLQAFLFAGERDRKLVVWSADAVSRTVSLPVGAAVDTLGLTVATRAPGDRSTIVIGAAPVYLQGAWTDGELAAIEAFKP